MGTFIQAYGLFREYKTVNGSQTRVGYRVLLIKSALSLHAIILVCRTRSSARLTRLLNDLERSSIIVCTVTRRIQMRLGVSGGKAGRELPLAGPLAILTTSWYGYLVPGVCSSTRNQVMRLRRIPASKDVGAMTCVGRG